MHLSSNFSLLFFCGDPNAVEIENKDFPTNPKLAIPKRFKINILYKLVSVLNFLIFISKKYWFLKKKSLHFESALNFLIFVPKK